MSKVKETEIRKAYEEWKEKNDISDYMRLGDTDFHEQLCYNPETKKCFIATLAQGSFIKEAIIIHEFMNGQNLANMDTTNYEGIFIDHETLTDADITEEKIKKILNGKEEIAFDEVGCNEKFASFLENLRKTNLITEDEEDEIREHARRDILVDFLIDEEMEEMDSHFERVLEEKEPEM